MRVSEIKYLMVLSFHVLILVTSSVVSADTIWLIENKQPLYGMVASQNAESIVFRQTTNGTQFKKIAVSKSDIETIVINFDSQRLSRLSTDNFLGYAEYAEELQSQRKDPVAQTLALRLLVIVIGNSKDVDLRRSSLFQLVSLARNDAEMAKFQRLLYLETGIPSSRVEATNPVWLAHTPESRIAAIELIKRVRQGKSMTDQIDDVQVKETIDQFESVCSWNELIQISKSNRINNQQLGRLVELESRLRKAGARNGEIAEDPNQPWNLLAKRIGIKDVDILGIESVTEFDPNDVHFVDGQWVPIGR